MNFKDKYTSTALNEKDKIVISNDNYALCEVLEDLRRELSFRMRDK
jgi:hypothetical protein